MNGKVRNDTGSKAFVCASAVEEARRVTIDANGQIAHAAANALGDGVTDSAGAVGDIVTVHFFNKSGTVPITGSEALALGDNLYAAADGKVQNTPVAAGTYVKVGKNVGYATTADGGVAEVLPTSDAGSTLTVN